MPAVTISDESMAKVEELIDASEYALSKKAVVDRAIRDLHEREVGED